MKLKGRIVKITGNIVVVEIGNYKEIKKVNKEGKVLGSITEFVKRTLQFDMTEDFRGKTVRMFIRE